jgi:hypothetical protein
VSIRLDTFDRGRHRQELRRYTDLELILAGRQLRSLIRNGEKHRLALRGITRLLGTADRRRDGGMAQPAGIAAGRRGRMPVPRSGQPGDHAQGANVESVRQ